ncbi:F-box only protein 34 [Gadus chalcogrammus]|uniref:F-box only protein 34 n=1 Tax=Gadus chalcogrammus TaxID=1042646 RepID=UPI0024C3816D|nr:F-box only protein 34 [Gadus chalcogrammus]
MHLQAYPLPQRSPRRAQQGEVLRAAAAAGNRGNPGGGTRHPLSVLSGNTSHRHGNGPTHRGNDKTSSRGPAPPPPGCHDDQEEPWSVVRPGYVREKIAMFASSPPPSPPPPPTGAEDPEEAFGSTGGGGLKVKGGWERESRSAKRPRRSGGRGLAAGGGGAEPEEAVSVGEMVASLEQRMTSGPGGGGEAVRVWDLVARLESECVKGPSGPGRRLLRGVGRVLLTHSSSSCSSSSSSSSCSSSSSSPQPPSAPPTPAPGSGSEARLEVQRPRARPPTDPQTLRCGQEEEEEEEEPGKLFFSSPLVQIFSSSSSSSSSARPRGEPAVGGSRSSRALPPTSPPLLLLPSPDSCGAPELDVRRAPPRGGGGGALEQEPGASQDFLEARFQLQLLLEPQPALLLLPQHLLLHILSLLPTHSLAALKCCCRHFASLMDAYGVRAADSRWVGDPRYRDDPCKQCKRRYRRGDVSLCRWHHKPYCQALPYGPGHWMCCHGTRKDAPGCNVGLHDNRWVPDFHSFTSALYMRRRGESADEA